MGRGNARLIAWEGDKTLTLTFTDALLSPIGLAVLSGAGLFKSKNSEDKVHFHMTTLATMGSDGVIDLTDAVAALGVDDAAVCVSDAPIYIMEAEDDGSLTANVVSGAITADGNKLTVAGQTAAKNVFVDYYVDLPGEQVYEADITTDKFAGYYYVEGDVLVRDQASGKDMPGALTIPNAKLQSNFTITMASTGDPSELMRLAA